MNDAVISEAVAELLNGTFSAVVATVRPDGAPAMAVVWVDWDGQHIAFSAKVGSRKGRNLRTNPQLAVSIHDPVSGSWAAIRGQLAEIRDDEGLAFIDRMSQRHNAAPYGVREFDREIYVVRPVHVRSRIL